MTGEAKTEVIEQAARAGRDQRWRRFVYGILAAAALCIAFGIVLLVYQFATTGALRGQVDDLSSAVHSLAGQQSVAAAGEQALASQLRGMGATPVVVPQTPVSGAAGPVGPNGQPGRGITGTSITSGHLIVAYTDGHTQDAGQVVGADGKTGQSGRGITSTSVTSGHLIVAYSDNTTADLGNITGPKGTNGRSVVSVTVNSDFHLIVSYDDGTTADAGALPPGPAGATGPTGPQGQQGVQGDPGPACPAGYSPHQAIITEPDGSTHQGVACVADNETTTTTAPTTTGPLGLIGH